MTLGLHCAYTSGTAGVDTTRNWQFVALPNLLVFLQGVAHAKIQGCSTDNAPEYTRKMKLFDCNEKRCTVAFTLHAWKACMKALLGCSWEVIVSRSCRILASTSAGPSMTILRDCIKTLHDLVQVLVRRSCGDPVEILLKRSLHQ